MKRGIPFEHEPIEIAIVRLENRVRLERFLNGAIIAVVVAGVAVWASSPHWAELRLVVRNCVAGW